MLILTIMQLKKRYQSTLDLSRTYFIILFFILFPRMHLKDYIKSRKFCSFHNNLTCANMDKNYCPICEMKFSRKDVLMRKISNAYPQTTEVYPPPTLPQKEVIPSPPPPSHIPLERSSQSRPCSEQKYQDRFTFQHPFTMTVTGATFCGKKYLKK